MVCYSHLFQNFPQFIVIHTVKGFGIVTKVEIDVFLELSCSFNDPSDVGNLISGSSAFSKTSLNIWEFMVHVLLKPGLENFEHYFTSMCDDFLITIKLLVTNLILIILGQFLRMVPTSLTSLFILKDTQYRVGQKWANKKLSICVHLYFYKCLYCI